MMPRRLVELCSNLNKFHFLQNMWLLSDSSKNIRDIGLRFREERNTLKTQVTLFIHYLTVVDISTDIRPRGM